MYLSHFNLTEKPFQITPDPRFLWLGEKHQEALATLKYGVLDRKGFLLLTGDVGTGKTTLIKALLNSLDNSTVVATVVDPQLDKLEFFNFLAEIFGLKEIFTKKVDFLTRFTQFLHSTHSVGKTVLLIIDEAQRLSKELLEEIRLLSNIEKQDTKLLNIFFVGQNEFNALLTEHDSRALRQRITITYQIKPLTEAEAKQYVSFRLKVAGTEEQIFDSKAIREIFRFSKGYPRLINVICDHALLTAYVRDMKRVSLAVVKECAKELTLPGEKLSNGIQLRGSTTPRKSLFLPKAALWVCLLLLLATSGYLINPGGFRRVFEQATAYYGQLARSQKVLEQIEEGAKSGPSGTERSQAPSDSDSQTVIFRALPMESGANDSIEPALGDSLQDGPAQEDSGGETDQQFTATQHRGYNPDNSVVQPDSAKSAEPLVFLAQNSALVVPFDYDTNELSAEAQVALDEVATAMGQDPDMEIVVSGYTDTMGSRHYNMKLSEFRAQVVKSYVVAKGISPSRIQAVGMAEQHPLDTNDTPAGRALNRRVEIRLKAKNDL